MEALKNIWKDRIKSALMDSAEKYGADAGAIDHIPLILETPPKVELGDLAFPLFPFARVFKMNPAQIAAEVAEILNKDASLGSAEPAGPYVNIKLDLSGQIEKTVSDVNREGNDYGRTLLYKDEKIMVEFSCPNTNKPLHLGHLRNDSIGESVSRILSMNSADVRKVNLINDRGIHICKSMLAYKKFGGETTPESEGIKSDHFVGKYYVKYNEWSKEYPGAEEEARAMLRAWEAGDPEVTALWEKMNNWTISGVQETYRKTGISFDKFYFESETYKLGKAEILRGLEKGVFYSEKDGSVWADLSEINLDKKVLLRSDGTSLYLTQDIGTAIARHKDWPFERLIYVVGSEQQYHFKVLFFILKKLGFKWAEKLYHLSYGMVNLPEGKMKSREGTVVDADDLFQELKSIAFEEIESKDRISEVGDVEKTTDAVALAALNYYLLQVSPGKDMIFNPKDSISFNGNTGPYLQYMGARISSMLRKFEERKEQFAETSPDFSSLREKSERELVKLLSSFPAVVREAGEEMSPAVVTGYLYDLTKLFSRFYHDVPVLNDENKSRVLARIELVKAIRQVLKNGFSLVGVPFLDRM
ncbi:MAG: arginine--tRNA ligase [Spirochaetes bacterium]|nr:MAG: arginine--tRNA ligase [Spirochaetota bacterium]